MLSKKVDFPSKNNYTLKGKDLLQRAVNLYVVEKTYFQKAPDRRRWGGFREERTSHKVILSCKNGGNSNKGINSN